jgi:DNA-binding XRE family transcriptional regulator
MTAAKFAISCQNSPFSPLCIYNVGRLIHHLRMDYLEGVMSVSSITIALEKFTTFGDLLKYLRRRAGYTQRELSIAVGYSDTQISRLEHNERLPDVATLTARFLPVLQLDKEPEVARRLLAARRRPYAAKTPRPPGCPPTKGCTTLTRPTPRCSLAARR